jgi:hypothetical protein
LNSRSLPFLLFSLLQHPNLLKCYGGHTKNDNYALVTELMKDNIFNLLNKKDFKIDMPTIIKIAIQAHKTTTTTTTTTRD